jgi:limonene-1,2-epoxide hydrolase
MNRNLIVLTFIGITLLVACQPAAPATAVDPTTVIDQYIAAINAHDVEAALQFVSNDAVFSPEGNQIKGKSEIKKFIEDNLAQLVSVKRVGEFKIDGEKVSWTERGQFRNPFPGGKVMEVVTNLEAIVRNGKIVSLTGTAVH